VEKTRPGLRIVAGRSFLPGQHDNVGDSVHSLAGRREPSAQILLLQGLLL
jgi:hypothetical protein